MIITTKGTDNLEKILKDTFLNNTFHERGYVTFPLFTHEQIQEIKAFYKTIISEHTINGNVFHTTLNTSNKSLINKINNFLRPYFLNSLNTYIEDFHLTIAGFLAKDSGKNSSVTLHQDWSCVDEEKFSAFNLWVALDDTNLYNGNMQFIPGSHKFVHSLRITPDIPGYFADFKDQAADYLVDVPTKAGECVMFNVAILHASRRNYSKAQRVACVTCGYPKNADLLIHYLPTGKPFSKIERYKININSMIDLQKDQKPPHSEFLGYINYVPPKVNFEDFKETFDSKIPIWYRYRNRLINKFLGRSS